MALQPGTWGVAHGSGFLGNAIRQAELDMSASKRFPQGDREASWAGHAFVYVGDGNIVQAEWPKAVVSPATSHADAIWATGQPLTLAQRTAGTAAAMALVGASYDWLSYLHFLAAVAKLKLSGDLGPLFAAEAKAGPICSGVVVREQIAMGIDIGPLKTAATQDPDFIAPADLLRWGLDHGWMDRTVPDW